MRHNKFRTSAKVYHVLGATATFAVLVVASLVITPAAHAGRNWDAGSGTQWWFDPVNWTNDVLPPSNAAMPPGTTDTDIVISTNTLPGGEGIIFDPSSNDPNFANAVNLQGQNQSGFGPQYTGTTYTGYIIQQLYVGRAQGGTLPVNSQVTLKGDLTAMNNIIIGRSSGARDVAVNAAIVQKAGKVSTTGNLDVGQTDPPGQLGYGNGTYDYQGGTLDVMGSTGLRLSGGSVTAITADTKPAGAGGIAKLVVHNPAAPGYIRTTNLIFNSFPGVPASTDMGLTNEDPNGVTKGVGIAEFHYDNGGVRPVQVAATLTINNGRNDPGATPATTDTNGTRSARLGLVLDAAPMVTAGVPQNLGLIDVDWSADDFFTGSVSGTGDIDGDMVYNDDRVFSNEFAANPLDVSAAYYQDSIVSAIFGSTKYNWKISYTGKIAYVGGDGMTVTGMADQSAIGSIDGTGGMDVVLIGMNTETVMTGIPGDYNDNGVVDTADYAVWRKNNGTNNVLLHDPIGGTIGPAQYNQWRANFGKPPGAGSGVDGSPVPEPSAMMLAIAGAIGLFAGRRRRVG